MRVLIVSPWLPLQDALHAGGKSLYHEMVWLAQRHEVHIVCYGHGEAVDSVAALKAWCRTVTVIEPSYTSRQKLDRFVRGGWRQPWTLGRNTVLTMQTTIREVCREYHVDTVVLVWTEMGCYLDVIPPGIERVLVMQDIESIVRPREVPYYPPGQARIMAALRARRLIAIERQSMSRTDRIIVRSQHDRAQLSRIGSGKRILVVPVYFETECLSDIQPETRFPGQLTFFGALDRVANLASVRFLMHKVWPQVRDCCPHSRLMIAGANPPVWLINLAAPDPRITVTGYVADIRRMWAETDIAVLPGLVGGGMLVKIAQAMSAGRPVVTTSIGNEGIGAPPEAIVVADSPTEVATSIAALLRDRTRWTGIAQAGQNYVREGLDWGAGMQRLESAITASVAARKTNL